ncbi:MAG: radical SAM family heme chaperone HemW [Alcanivoracaceae bacterium]
MSTASPIPLSFYIHVPWCVRKCPYCDFNSHERGDIPEQSYLAALQDDLVIEAARAAGRTVKTIFIGGGTPSLMSGDFYRALLTRVRDQLDLATDAEITLEANPGTVEQGRFEAYREAGINRLSIGVQSFNPTHLRALGRIHGRDEAVRAAEAARRAGFDNFNLDLMHGLPEQGRAEALEDLEQAIALGPTHLSWYELTIEPNTAFYSHPPRQPDSDEMADTEEAGFALLARHGYARYEISAFSQPGRRCRHNLNYWEFGDYLGIGAGAHGKVTDREGRVLRYQKTRLPEHYLAGGDRTRQQRWLAPDELPTEYFLNTLRLIEGAPTALFGERTGLPLNVIEESLALLRSKHLLTPDTTRIACSELGIRHLNQVLELL